METIKSTLLGQEFNLNDLARVPDRRLQILYIKHGVKPVDVYAGIDDAGKDIIVMLFRKKETSELFTKWKNHELV